MDLKSTISFIASLPQINEKSSKWNELKKELEKIRTPKIPKNNEEITGKLIFLLNRAVFIAITIILKALIIYPRIKTRPCLNLPGGKVFFNQVFIFNKA
jgi:hypothetical protein